MRRILFAVVVAAFALAANAQVWIGGSLGASTSKETNKGEKTNSGTGVKIIPTIGYTYNADWDFILDLSYEHSDDSSAGYNYNSFGFAPYARYKFVKTGAFKAFVEGGFSYRNAHVSHTGSNNHTWDIFIRPGISYDLSKKVSIDAKVGDVRYEFYKSSKYKINSFDLDLHSDVQFGVYYKF